MRGCPSDRFESHDPAIDGQQSPRRTPSQDEAAQPKN